jgi:hypothetical protein
MNMESAWSTVLTLEQRIVRREVQVWFELDRTQALEAHAALKRGSAQSVDEVVLHAGEYLDERGAVNLAPLIFGFGELCSGQADE